MQKIFSVINLFYKKKDSHKDIYIPQSKKCIYIPANDKLFAESSLQKYFADKFPQQLSKINIKSINDFIPTVIQRSRNHI